MMKLTLICFLLLASVCQAQVLIISDQLPPPVKYPAKVAAMTDDEFFQWATKVNKKQVVALEKRAAKLNEPKFIEGWETDISLNYSGYSSRRYGYGSVNTSSVESPRSWVNNNYVSPGPLTIINPFVKPKQ